MSKGYEVLYLTDAIDEATITNLQKFGDFQLTDVSKEGLEVCVELELCACADLLSLSLLLWSRSATLVPHLCKM